MSETKERQIGHFLAVDSNGQQYCILVVDELAGYRTDKGAAEWVTVRQILREINGGAISRYAKGQYILARRTTDPLGYSGPSEYIELTSNDPNAV